VVPRALSSYGDRTFAAAGPRLLNSLPFKLRRPESRHHLRTVQTTAEGTPFFGKHEHGALTSDMQRLRKTFTYLLTYLLTYYTRCTELIEDRTEVIENDTTLVAEEYYEY